MAEGGIGTNEYQRFIEEPSSNYDDSGFFSVQVITEALSVWGLDIVLFNSQDPVAVQAREDPTQMSAFICNYLQHWFCVRKLGRQWFNLNSLLSGPELISDTYLSLFLTQLQQEGYCIFIVVGNLPECEADQLLRLMPAVQTVKPRLVNEKDADIDDGAEVDEDDKAFKEALRVSKELLDSDDTALQRALQMSMEGYMEEYSQLKLSTPTPTISNHGASTSSSDDQPATQEELRRKRMAFLNKQASNTGLESESRAISATDTGQADPHSATDTGQADSHSAAGGQLLSYQPYTIVLKIMSHFLLVS
ncbi:unnamed protein product [Lymnaea stagnalis]|uniref:ubiquitinyl hydrolase 1 n=1 Tax=Lymnaea stagnalis TaxID=6523 RepID=A0AAV2HS25_LYMST